MAHRFMVTITKEDKETYDLLDFRQYAFAKRNDAIEFARSEGFERDYEDATLAFLENDGGSWVEKIRIKRMY